MSKTNSRTIAQKQIKSLSPANRRKKAMNIVSPKNRYLKKEKIERDNTPNKSSRPVSRLNFDQKQFRVKRVKLKKK